MQTNPFQPPAPASALPSAAAEVSAHPGGVPRIRVKARAVAVDRGYRFDTALLKALKQRGIEVSGSKLSRFLNNQLEHLDLPLLEALMSLLQCQLSDLLEVTPATH